MARIMMPEPNYLKAKGEKRFILDPNLVKRYLNLPDQVFIPAYNSLGSGNTMPPPTPPNLSTSDASATAAGMAGQALAGYQAFATKLNSLQTELTALEKKIPPITAATAEIAQNARQSINHIINTMSANATMTPQSADQDENTWVMTFVGMATGDLSTAMDQARTDLSDNANGTQALTNQVSALADQITAGKLQEASDTAALKSLLGAGGGAGNGNTGNGSVGNSAADLLKDLGLSQPGGSDSGKIGGSNSPNGNDGNSSTLGNGSDTTGNSSGTTGNGGPNDPIGDSTGGTGNIPTQVGSTQDGYNASSMPDLASLEMLSTIPNLLSSMNQGFGPDPALNAAYRMPQSPLPAAPLTPQPGTTPTAPIAASLAPQSVSPDGHNPGTPPSAASVMPAPDADGGVLYTYPDGKSQRVCVTVWKALDAAFHNPTVLDARQAYDKTSSSWSDDKHIGDPKDPYELITGDVVVWQDPPKTAIVRRLGGAGDDDQIEVIVDKRVQTYAEEMSDSTGSFKGFGGFARPRGITEPGKTADSDSSTPTGLPTDDPSAALNAAALPTTI
ncbi:hypothetical protein ACIRRA_37485 [Nocardia sp. NPDC101769]|uniref:hypothetical protein n=1 Tax=Nocardia sp. NPDC101769 TaxID=3364333 RepID=UPI0037F7EDD5